MTGDRTDIAEHIVDVDPAEADHSLTRIGQKKLSNRLVDAARYVTETRVDVEICDDQDEARQEREGMSGGHRSVLKVCWIPNLPLPVRPGLSI